MEMYDLLKHLGDTLDRLGIPYVVVGSVASILHGEPRYTNDIDVVVDLDLSRLAAFCAAFPPPDYYCSLEAAREAVTTRFQFNILHLTSGLKIDVIVPSNSAFDRSQLSRGIRESARDDFETSFASPEDVIIKKLEYFKLGGSEKHLRDIAGILKVQADAIEYDYIAEWVDKLSLQAEWKLVTDRLQGRTP
jgi:hypothetical protein